MGQGVEIPLIFMNIAVFCASSDNVGQGYRDFARELGRWIAREGHTLVYGGATGGLMDEVARGAREEEGEVIGIIPESIVERGRLAEWPTEIMRVGSLAERKEMMKEYADVFVALPGGFGTMDEMIDAISACKLGEVEAKTLIVNVNGFYDSLKAQIERFVSEGLGKKNDAECYSIVRDMAELTAEIGGLE